MVFLCLKGVLKLQWKKGLFSMSNALFSCLVAPEILAKDMNDRSIYESLNTIFEITAKGVPRPEAKWYSYSNVLPFIS